MLQPRGTTAVCILLSTSPGKIMEGGKVGGGKGGRGAMGAMCRLSEETPHLGPNLQPRSHRLRLGRSPRGKAENPLSKTNEPHVFTLWGVFLAQANAGWDAIGIAVVLEGFPGNPHSIWSGANIRSLPSQVSVSRAGSLVTALISFLPFAGKAAFSDT